MPQPPLVSIGIPTFNREGTLPRAVESALGQTHAELEVVISDNASTDGTQALCEAFAQRDPRVRYVRRDANVGPTPNFNGLFETCSGEYVLMLADDDWLEPDYVERTLAELRADPGLALVAGRARYVRDGAAVHDGVPMQLSQPDGASRALGYYATVDDNGTFYGLMRGDALRAAAPMPNVLGNDWLLIARVAFQGRVRTIETTHINRELEGTSADIQTILDTFGAASSQARMPHLYMAAHVFRDVARDSPVFAPLGGGARALLGARCALAVIDWPSLAWHMTAPAAASLGRRPRGRWAWRAYDRVTRALGAGQRP